MATNCIGPESINPRDQGQLVFPFENTIRRIRSWPAPTRRVINHAMRLLLAIFLCLPIHAAQRHFIWAIEHNNSRVYIAGAIHGMFPDSPPLPPVYRTILDAADRLILETDFGQLSSPDSIQYWNERAKTSSGNLVPTALKSQAQVTLLNAGVAPFHLETAWALAVTLEDLHAINIGIDFDRGVDYQLYAQSLENGTDVIGLADYQEHIDVLPSVPFAEQLQWLESALDPQRDPHAEWSLQLDLWRAGDLEAMALLDSPTTPGYEQVYAARNRAWLPAIRNLLDLPGLSFVVVGASHLGRADGILEGLRRMGFHPTQIEQPELTLRQSSPGFWVPVPNLSVGTTVMESSTDLETWSPTAEQPQDAAQRFWRARWTP